MAFEYVVVSERVISGNARFHQTRKLTPDVRAEFIRTVESHLNDGWSLQGGVATDTQGFLLQAMYREGDG